MNVLVDTSVWSAAFRRAAPHGSPEELELRELIAEGRVVMIGPVRQELLSGIRNAAQFDKLRVRLRAFPDLKLERADYEEAASCFNRRRSRGVQGSNTDFLICAVASRRSLAILTTDQYFVRFARLLQIVIHPPR